MSAITRRRFLAISAAALGGPLLKGVASAAGAQTYVWKGVALGAEASLRIDGIDAAAGERIAELCCREIERLERLFSLYRSDSAVSRLNRTGALADPDPDFLAIVSAARAVHDATGGAFDPTVQPQWAALARRYAGREDDRDAPAVFEAAGLDRVRVAASRIAFDRPDMAITLNGIAQGYITDRVADLLVGEGLRNVLVNIGELRAIGPRRDGAGWPVGIRAPGRSDLIVRTVRLSRSALATSEPRGTTFDRAGKVGHILDPRSGLPADRRQSVSVEAPSATLADALSTAFCLMGDAEIGAALAAFPGARIAGLA